MLFLKQPKRLSTFFAARADTLGWCSTWCLPGPWDPLLEHCLPADWPPACTGTLCYSSCGTGLCISLCHTLWNSCQPTSPACTEGQYNHLVYQWLLHFSIICKCAESIFCPIIQVINDVKQYWYWLLGYTITDRPPADFMLPITTLQAWQFSQFWIHLSFHLSSFILTALKTLLKSR